MERTRQKQEKIGVVTSTKMNKTIVVAVQNTFMHPAYKRVIKRTKTFTAHDERQESNVDDVVRIVQTRPLSKTKRWRLKEIVERAK